MGHWVYKWGLLVRNSGEQSVGHMTNLKYLGLEIRSLVFRAIRLFFCEWKSDSLVKKSKSLPLLFCRAGNSLICSALIRSDAHFAQIKWATVSDLLRSLKTNEWPWATRSGRSEEISNREQITQVAQDKWSTVSNWLRSLMINEGMSDSLKKCWLKKNLKSCFLVCFINGFFV